MCVYHNPYVMKTTDEEVAACAKFLNISEYSAWVLLVTTSEEQRVNNLNKLAQLKLLEPKD